MEPSTILSALLAMLLPLLLLVSGEVTDNSNNNNTLKDQIVIHTPLQNYEQPTLRDYDECHRNRETCMTTCDADEKCQAQCPLCPELSDEPLLVQGVNDTSYVPPAQPPVNTTNIIRLTNEINNIINNDILARNEINVKVQQNVSQVGGRFGLGYNEQGSCCYVVRRDRECEHKEHCEETSRQRVCGKRCQARVMVAKRVVQCDKDQPEEACHETLEYVPARKRKSHSRKQSPDCRYTNSWPYILCEDRHDRGGSRVRRAACQKCLELTYGFILQHGLPPQCYGCFQGYGAPMMSMPMWYPPPYGLPNFGYNPPQLDSDNQIRDQDEGDNNSSDSGDSGWILKTQKCLTASGNLEDCLEGSGGEEFPNDLKPSPPAHLEQGNKKEWDYNVPAQRRRRRRHHQKNQREFVRSMYSLRQDN